MCNFSWDNHLCRHNRSDVDADRLFAWYYYYYYSYYTYRILCCHRVCLVYVVRLNLYSSWCALYTLNAAVTYCLSLSVFFFGINKWEREADIVYIIQIMFALIFHLFDERETILFIFSTIFHAHRQRFLLPRLDAFFFISVVLFGSPGHNCDEVWEIWNVIPIIVIEQFAYCFCCLFKLHLILHKIANMHRMDNDNTQSNIRYLLGYY